MTKLTTHVLDIYSGKPGNGIVVDLFYINNNERKKINSVKLNSDGRSDKPLAEGENFLEGKYELIKKTKTKPRSKLSRLQRKLEGQERLRQLLNLSQHSLVAQPYIVRLVTITASLRIRGWVLEV